MKNKYIGSIYSGITIRSLEKIVSDLGKKYDRDEPIIVRTKGNFNMSIEVVSIQ